MELRSAKRAIRQVSAILIVGVVVAWGESYLSCRVLELGGLWIWSNRGVVGFCNGYRHEGLTCELIRWPAFQHSLHDLLAYPALKDEAAGRQGLDSARLGPQFGMSVGWKLYPGDQTLSWVVLPYWLWAMVPLLLWWRLRARAAGTCARCGYDLRGSTGLCSECGHPMMRPKRTGE